MADEKNRDSKLPTVSVSPERVEELLGELKNRLMLVTSSTVNHLQSHGVIRMERPEDKCCKPDGGTCCVNRKPEVK